MRHVCPSCGGATSKSASSRGRAQGRGRGVRGPGSCSLSPPDTVLLSPAPHAVSFLPASFPATCSFSSSSESSLSDRLTGRFLSDLDPFQGGLPLFVCFPLLWKTCFSGGSPRTTVMAPAFLEPTFLRSPHELKYPLSTCSWKLGTRGPAPGLCTWASPGGGGGGHASRALRGR